MSDRDPWTWLLGKTPAGAWRHVPYQANQLGQGRDPGQEPRVEVIRRLIAYPAETFRTVIESVMAADRPDRPLRWCCYRDPGNTPARPYWLCILSEKAGGRRFHIGLELFDRSRLGLWFFSGFAPSACESSMMAPFPAKPEVALPRLELSDDELAASPAERWVVEALEDKLRFERDATKVPANEQVIPPTSTGMISESILGIPDVPQGPLGLRNARARLVTELQDEEGKTTTTVHPLGRLSNIIGRDPRSNIVLNHPNISHEHCKISWRNGEPGIEELGSKNGTTVNDVPVVEGTPQVLPVEAKIELGGVPCLFVRDVPTTPGKDPPRHQDRVKKLVAAGKLTKEEEQQIYVEARGRGITPGEVLLDRGKITLSEWYGKPGGGCGLGVLLFFLLFFLAGCHSAGFPPLYEHELDPTPTREGERRVDWDVDIGLKPIFQARVSEEPSRIEAHLLFPLGLWESTPDQSILRLYPLFQHIERTDPDGFEDSDTILFPLVFTGSHPVDGGYFYLFPLGGTLRGLLGKDEAVGVLFPLYAWTRDRDFESHHILWPLISWNYDDRGSKGFRFLPFYGHQEKRNEDGELVFNRTTILWPFISWASDSTNSRNKFDSFFIFPFYGQTRSAWVDDNTILWPLFRWWKDKRTGYEEYRVPFPFLIWGEGPGHTRFDVWPLFGFRERGDYKRHFFLWPIERYEYVETEEYKDARLWILPVFYTHHRVYKDGSGEDIKTKFLPFVRYESRRDGSKEIRVLQPLWFTDPLLNFDSILAPFWTLFHYKRDSEGYEHLNLFFGMFSSRTTPDGEYRWDILGGLIGHTSNPGGDEKAEGKTRILWFLEF